MKRRDLCRTMAAAVGVGGVAVAHLASEGAGERAGDGGRRPNLPTAGVPSIGRRRRRILS